MKISKVIFVLLFFFSFYGCTLLGKKQETVDLTQKAADAYQIKDYAITIDYAKQALEKNPQDVRARYYLACALFETKKIKEAKKHFETIIKGHPLSPETNIVKQKWLPMIETELTELKLDEGKAPEVVQKEKEQIDIPQFLISEPRLLEYPKFTMERSSEAMKYYQLGLKQKRKGDLTFAIASLEKAVELDANFAPPYMELGIAYSRKGLFDKAVEALKKSLDLDPTNLIARYNLGVIYEGRGSWTQAIAEYMKVVSSDPNNVMVRTRLGICLAEAGQSTAAIDQWNIAITIDPNYKEARVLLGKIYSETGDIPFVRVKYKLTYDEKKHSLEYTRETEGGGEEPKALHPGYLFYDAAIEQYIEALKIDLYLAEAYAGLGFTFARAALRGRRLFHPYHRELRDNYTGAVRLKMTIGEMLQWATYYLKKAIELEPQSAYYHCNLGVVYAERGLYESAIRHLKKAVRIDSRVTAAHANLALVYSYQGQIEQARYDYERIARVHPADVRTIESLRLLQPEIKKEEKLLITTPVSAVPTPLPPATPPPPPTTTPPGTMPLLK